MPYALCPMPYALGRIVPHLSEKGYSLAFSELVGDCVSILCTYFHVFVTFDAQQKVYTENQ